MHGAASLQARSCHCLLHVQLSPAIDEPLSTSWQPTSHLDYRILVTERQLAPHLVGRSRWV